MISAAKMGFRTGCGNAVNITVASVRQLYTKRRLASINEAPFSYDIVRSRTYFSTLRSLPTFMKAAMHLSSCSLVWAAEICTLMRAWSLGTTG